MSHSVLAHIPLNTQERSFGRPEHFAVSNPQEISMAHLAQSHMSARLKSHADEQRQCQRLVSLTFLFFVPAVLVRRVMKQGPPRSQGLSILSEARARASAIVPFIFMG
jgi:hypothetical protein